MKKGGGGKSLLLFAQTNYIYSFIFIRLILFLNLILTLYTYTYIYVYRRGEGREAGPARIISCFELNWVLGAALDGMYIGLRSLIILFLFLFLNFEFYFFLLSLIAPKQPQPPMYGGLNRGYRHINFFFFFFF